MPDQLLVFDMDGVLVDVSDSYRETICRTVGHFCDRQVTREEIQAYKNRGGWNDDWKLSHHMIAEAGVQVAFQAVVDYFQSVFHGNGADGLILRERWIASEGFFERLSRSFELAVFTGRLGWEARLTLERFAREIRFAPIVGADDVVRHKPEPDGLLLIREQSGGKKLWYIGDTVDDARCARLAGVPFIGIAAPAALRRSELVELFQAEQALAVIEDINQLEGALAR